jgi:tRNA modification GTPase
MSAFEDTIVAIATPEGVGALGIIRLSGKNSIAVVAKMFAAKNLLLQASHTLHVGALRHNNVLLDEVVVSIYKNPKSFTGEDIVEISCHGSAFILQKIIEACLANGARLAKAGEFTQRAFLHGKLDLAQAEAVADIIASNSAASQQTALHKLRGGLSNDLKSMRERLVTFAALIELELDFSQEDVEFADRTQFVNLINEITNRTNELLDSFVLGNAIKNGVTVAIVGKPNAGKSTLLNALLNEERAIVSNIAGTTRDTIEEALNINGIQFALIDTAGIRQNATDEIELIGIERSLQKIDAAEIIMPIVAIDEITNANQILQHEVIALALQKAKELQKKCIIVFNKLDACKDETIIAACKNLENSILISALQKQGVDTLKTALYNAVIFKEINTDNTIITNARHVDSLKKLQQSLFDINTAIAHNIPSDLIALDIRQALHFLGEITGEITNDDLLDYVFSKFCIGK